MYKIAIVGIGYIGLTAGIGLADFGSQVLGLDIDEGKIQKLNRGLLPIYEPGILEVMSRNVEAARLRFSSNLEEGIKWADVIFIAVGTPQGEDGNADLQALYAVGKTIAVNLDRYKVIVIKSTVSIGTNEKLKIFIQSQLASNIDFDIVSNPEFLREGKAMYDFLHPNRVVIGTETERPIKIMQKIYRPLYLNEVPFVLTNLRTAETIKYASNCFLATKVAFINEMARLCDSVGADVKVVGNALGKDGRIGSKFLRSGPGYGGSCFPKDTHALVAMAKEFHVDLSVIEAVIESNIRQKEYVVMRICKIFRQELNHKRIAILGLAFKPDTDDMRESASIIVIEQLLNSNVDIRVFDPQAMENAKKIWDEKVSYAKNEYDAIQNADALVILTEWNQFRNLDLTRIRKIMRDNKFFDFRNIYKRKEVEEVGLHYIGMGS